MNKMDRYVNYVVKELCDLTKVDISGDKILIIYNGDLLSVVSFDALYGYSSIDIMSGNGEYCFSSLFNVLRKYTNPKEDTLRKKILCRYLSRMVSEINQKTNVSV
jgi:tRNA-dihydrouridine synthase